MEVTQDQFLVTEEKTKITALYHDRTQQMTRNDGSSFSSPESGARKGSSSTPSRYGAKKEDSRRPGMVGIWTYRRCKGSHAARSTKAAAATETLRERRTRPSRASQTREGEVSGLCDGARGGSGSVRRLGLVEPSPAPVLEEPEEGRRVEEGLEEPAEEAAAGGDAAEGGADGGGAREVGRRGEAEEDVLQYLVGEGRLPPDRRHRRRRAAPREKRAGSEGDWDWTVDNCRRSQTLWVTATAHSSCFASKEKELRVNP